MKGYLSPEAGTKAVALQGSGEKMKKDHLFHAGSGFRGHLGQQQGYLMGLKADQRGSKTVKQTLSTKVYHKRSCPG